MMIGNPYQQYRSMAVETASPVELVAMLYQGVLRFTQRGIYAVEHRDVPRANESFLRAQAIVLELATHLDMEQGGDIAKNLAALYDYAYRKLVDANVKKAVAPAEEVVLIFRELLPAWQALADGNRPSVAQPRPTPLTVRTQAGV